MEASITESQPRSALQWLGANLIRVLISLFVPLITGFVLWQGFIFLRDSEAPGGIIAAVAIVWGVGGVAVLYFISNWIVEQLPVRVSNLVKPFVFVGPALAILGWYLFMPTVRTVILSFYGASGKMTPDNFVAFDNFIFAFTDKAMIESFANNLMWLVLGTGFSVGFGLLIAVLADRSRFEVVAKALIFMPMAISFVGSAVIWNFMYAFKPATQAQIGLLNAITVALGNEPQGWLQTTWPWNNLFLIVILVWMQTGYAMVLLSAALKGVPEELLEAARIDGANEFQIFFRIIIPYIRGTIITVSTTIVILTLKIFDIVFVMTSGNYNTEVMASQQYKQMFRFQNFGRGSAVAIVLLIAVIPVMWYNLRQFAEQEGF